MARANSGAVFKSASTGVLRPMGGRLGGRGQEADEDPLAAVLNHSWNRPTQNEDDKPKRAGIASRTRGAPNALMNEMSGMTSAGIRSKDEKSKDEGARSRLAAAGTSLSVDTGAKNRFAPTFEEDSPPGVGAESPPTSPDQPGKPARRAKQKEVAAPTRKYQNEMCPDSVNSPKLLPAPHCRKGQVKLNYEDDAKEGNDEHGQAEVGNGRVRLDKEQEHFIDLAHHVQGAVNQAGIRMNSMLLEIRKHFLEDDGRKWLEDVMNFNQLTEIAFEVQTANYYLAKWNHHLEPRKVPAPARPTKIEDMSAEDVLAQALYSVSKMEVLASKLGPMLEKICHEAKTARRGPNGEPLTPTSKNALLLAKKRGFQDIDDFNKILGHLEHTLSVTQHLATPPVSGLPEIKKTFQVVMAASKFKRMLKKPKTGAVADPDSPKAPAVAGAFGNAMKGLASSVEKAAAEGG